MISGFIQGKKWRPPLHLGVVAAKTTHLSKKFSKLLVYSFFFLFKVFEMYTEHQYPTRLGKHRWSGHVVCLRNKRQMLYGELALAKRYKHKPKNKGFRDTTKQ